MDDSPPPKRSRRSSSPCGRFKRSRLPPPPLSIGVGNVLFRLLCPVPLSGGVIGKSGSIVKNLQNATSSKIRVEESPPGCEERVIVIIASKSPSKKFTLTDEEGFGDEEVAEVSAAQDAVIRVFERMVEVMGEEREAPGDEGIVTCRLLAEKRQVGGVIGRGGKVIEKIRKDTQCKVNIRKERNMPLCALPDEEMLEMEGNVLAVKKALLAVTSRLQECQPVESARLGGSRPYETPSDGNFSNFYERHAPDRMPNAPPSYYPNAPTGRYSSEFNRVPVLDPRSKQVEVVFRILCPNDRIGGVIGRGGKIINALQNETGAAITARGSVPGCNERLITITSEENPESQFSPAQNALVHVFNRSVEAGFEKGLQSTSNKTAFARLVVPENQLECLVGNRGAVISEMRMTTGADIRILEYDRIPKVVKEKDEVVEITGEFVNVQDALFKVTSRLRQNLFLSKIPNGYGAMTTSRSVDPYERAKDPNLGLHMSVGVSHIINPPSVLSHNITHLGLPHSYENPPTSIPWAPQAPGGVNPRETVVAGSRLPSVRGGIELGSGSRSAIVTNTMVEMVVSDDAIGSVYGENGRNLVHLGQISGAKIAVHEPRPGTSDWTIVVSGTPDETQAAQSLVQAFILTGKV